MRNFACLLWLLWIPALLWADDFAGFRVPQHSIYDLRGDLSGTFSRHSNTSNNANSKDWSGDGELGADGYWLYDSDPLLFKSTFNSSVSGQAQAYRSDATSTFRDLTRRRQSRTDESWDLNSGLRVYPEFIPEFPLGLIGGAQISGTYSQQWYYNRRESEQTENFYQRIDDQHSAHYTYNIVGDAGVGVGRVRDATAVYDWYKMEQRLRADGTLIRPLSHAVRQKLIDLVYFGNDYSRIHDRSGKFYWQEVERILTADSALGPQGLKAYDVFRMSEPYLDNNLPLHSDESYPGVRERNFSGYGFHGTSYYVMRQKGWFIGFLLFGQHNHDIGREFSRTRYYEIYDGEVQEDTVTDRSSHGNSWNDNIYYGPQGELHLPWGMDWQFDGVTSFTVMWDDYYHNQVWTTNASATYLIADRWLAFASLGHYWAVSNRWSATSKQDGKAWRVNAAAQVNYYLEDRVSLYANVSYSQSHGTDEMSGNGSYLNQHTWGTSLEARLGLTYNIFGKLEAPGVVPASTLPARRF